MKPALRPLACALSLLALAGCATYEPATPPDYTGPTVEVTDTAVTQSPQLIHMFELREVDGRRLRSSGIATVSANQGRGFSQQAVVVKQRLPVAPVKVTLDVGTLYAAPVLAMINPTCHVVGTVDFQPEADKSYAVKGKVSADVCAVWIEDVQAQVPVTAQVSGKGTK